MAVHDPSTAALLEQHREHDTERFAAMTRQFDESTKARHELRNDMLGGFGELRAAVGGVRDILNNRFWSLMLAIIVMLCSIVAYLINKHGI